MRLTGGPASAAGTRPGPGGSRARRRRHARRHRRAATPAHRRLRRRARGRCGARQAPPRPAAVVVCGMGGSAIGADLVLAVPAGLPVPGRRRPRIPAARWVDAATRWSSRSATRATRRRRWPAPNRRCGAGATWSASPRAAASRRSPRHTGVPLVRVPGGGSRARPSGYLAMPLLAALALGRPLRWPGEERRGGGGGAAAPGQRRLRRRQPSDANAGQAAGRRPVKRQAVVYGAGLTTPVRAPLEGPDQRERQGAGLLQRAAGARPQRAHGLDEPAARHGREPRGLSRRRARGDPRLLRRAELTAAAWTSAASPWSASSARGQSRLARLFSLVQLGDYVSFYLALLYGVDPTPVDAIQEFKAELAGGAAVADGAAPAVALADRRRRASGAARRRRAVPRASSTSRSARDELRPADAVPRAALRAARGLPAGACVGLVVPGRVARPGSGVAGPRAAPGRRRSRQPGAARPAHRPLAGRRAAHLPTVMTGVYQPAARSCPRRASGILVRRRGGGRRRRRSAHPVRGQRGPRAAASPRSPTHWCPPIIAAYYGLTVAACGVPLASDNHEE